MKTLIKIAKEYNKGIDEVLDKYSKVCYKIGYRHYVFKSERVTDINERALEVVDRYYRRFKDGN